MRRTAALLFALSLGLSAGPRPRLVLVVSVDQLSAETVSRWGGELPGGLGRLLREGTHFVAARHEHGYPETGPGHSVLLSGRHPASTGLTENNWFDRTAGAWVYCVGDPGVQTLGVVKKEGSGPRRFQGSTLAGWLKGQAPGARFFALSGKDRSAIPMAGPVADGVFWFEPAAGFTTSTAYAQALPTWLQRHNRTFLAGLEDASLVWEPIDPKEPAPPPERYELPGRTLTLGLPRLIQGVGMPLDSSFWSRFRASPRFDAAILDAAEALLEAENLGRSGATDVLALGLSATDYIGHRFGNAGPEMRDQIRRLDWRLGSFLAKVQRRDPGAWVVLVADHGCSDFCERLQQQGFPARRGNHKEWLARVERQVAERLGAPGPFLHAKSGSQQIWLRDEAIRASGKSRAEVVAASLAVLRTQPELAGAWAAEEIAAISAGTTQEPVQLSVPERIRRSFVPGRSGDFLIALQPLFTFDEPPDVVSHGSPWDYDRRVPMVFWGPWRAEVRREPVRTVDLAATLARELDLKPTEPLDGRPLRLERR